MIKIKASPRMPPIVANQLACLAAGQVAEEEVMVDKDRVVGSAKVVKGKLKEAVGKALGDAKLRWEGKADKLEGTVQNAIGGLKDAIKGK